MVTRIGFRALKFWAMWGDIMFKRDLHGFPDNP